MQLVFESPAHATGKRPEPSRTEPQKTEPLVAVITGFGSVAVAVFWFNNYLKPQATGLNRLQPTTVYNIYIYYIIYINVLLYRYIRTSILWLANNLVVFDMFAKHSSPATHLLASTTTAVTTTMMDNMGQHGPTKANDSRHRSAANDGCSSSRGLETRRVSSPWYVFFFTSYLLTKTFI